MILRLDQAIGKTVSTVWAGTEWGRTAVRYALDFYEFAGGGGEHPPLLQDINTELLDDWLARYPYASPSTQNRRLAAISKVFTTARQRGYTGPVPYFPRKKEPQHRTRFLTRDEEFTLARKLSAQDEASWRAMTILIDTGMRLGELKRLHVADLNHETGMILIPFTKGGASRSVPMSRRVADILGDPKGAQALDEPTFRKHWEVARGQMGLADDAQFVPHILRHTCASRLVQSGVPLKVIQEWLGHSDIAMTMRYAHLAPSNLSDALSSLEKFNAQS